MTAVSAIYDGEVFIPEYPCNITRGTKVTLSIENINIDLLEKQKKLAAFRQLTKKVHETNKNDPLPPEFDEILSQRVQFREFVGL